MINQTKSPSPSDSKTLSIPWSIHDLAKALAQSTTPMADDQAITFSSISTDSRQTDKNQLFVALKGDKFDAHTFIPDLIEAGIRGFVVEKEFLAAVEESDEKIICRKRAALIKDRISCGQVILFPVKNTLHALGMLARYQRLRAGVRVVAVTGSNGKTTTREMISKIFEQHAATLSTTGNLNNEIGLPLTLLKLSYIHQWAVVEMGMNHPGEISRLSNIALPDIAVVTNTAEAHLEGMATVNNVARAKGEITHGMTHGSTLILNCNDPRMDIIYGMARENKNIKNIICFGTGKNGDKCPEITAENMERKDSAISFTLASTLNIPGRTPPPPDHENDTGIFTVKNNPSSKGGTRITINSPAPFMLHNALAASASAIAAGITTDKIQRGLVMFKPVSGRMNIITRGNLHIIDDTYNANPASVKGSLKTLGQMAANHKNVTIAVLGDMLELGEKSSELHAEVGLEAAMTGVSRLYIFGDMGREVMRGAVEGGLSPKRAVHAQKEEISRHLKQYIATQDTSETSIYILVKGSRGMAMEEIVNFLLNLTEY
ncbi:MAG: UDP-N-acetylmuramoyl-tripeptide--D-alanyl-D-alanine ligase [Desulfamplus sp.]|nr:UDP-N-acetylmuramoyl-tripeptide--D-alanyl-D-alanine ligase [Desulfamplus sp.]